MVATPKKNSVDSTQDNPEANGSIPWVPEVFPRSQKSPQNIATDGRAGKTSGTKHAISDHANPIKTLEWLFSVRTSDVNFDWWKWKKLI